jgi:hypothetical protein
MRPFKKKEERKKRKKCSQMVRVLLPFGFLIQLLKDLNLNPGLSLSAFALKYDFKYLWNCFNTQAPLTPCPRKQSVIFA